MGLTWSAPKSVKNGTLYVVTAIIPVDKEISKKIWDFYRSNKDKLNNDGFKIAKNPQGEWQVNYWHNVIPSSNVLIGNKKAWEVDYIKKKDLWTSKFEGNNKVTKVTKAEYTDVWGADEKPKIKREVKKKEIENIDEREEQQEVKEQERKEKEGKKEINYEELNKQDLQDLLELENMLKKYSV